MGEIIMALLQIIAIGILGLVVLIELIFWAYFTAIFLEVIISAFRNNND